MREAGPDWVRDGVRQLVGEVRAFARTAAEFTRHPRRFGARWVGGGQQALNPLGFLATALAIVGGSEAVLNALVNEADSESASLARQVLGALGPFVYYLALGMTAHLVLRALGSQRRLRDSCAMALYAGGGPATAAHLLTLLAVYVAFRMGGRPGPELDFRVAANWWIVAGAVLGFALFCATLAGALAGLHAARLWKVALAMTIGLVLMAVAFGVLHPPGHYGLHPVMTFSTAGGKKQWGMGLSD